MRAVASAVLQVWGGVGGGGHTVGVWGGGFSFGVLAGGGWGGGGWG